MRWKSNYFEIQDLIIQFANAFDSIVIGRYNKNRVQKDRIFVRYLYDFSIIIRVVIYIEYAFIVQ